jgi:hypothetical protein
MSSQANFDLEIDLTGAVLVKWTGSASERHPATALNPLFDCLLSMGRYIRFDFSELQHLSSTTLIVVLRFFKKLNAMGVGFDFRYDRSVSWQRMMFAPASALAAAPSIQLADVAA